MIEQIFSGTFLEEVQNFEGSFIDVPESLDMPELAEEKELGKMTTFEKILFTISMRRLSKVEKIVEEVLKRSNNKILGSKDTEFNEYATNEEVSECEKLIIEAELINGILYQFVRYRFYKLDYETVTLLVPGYKVISGKPKTNISTIPIESTMSHLTNGIFGQPIRGEA